MLEQKKPIEIWPFVVIVISLGYFIFHAQILSFLGV